MEEGGWSDQPVCPLFVQRNQPTFLPLQGEEDGGDATSLHACGNIVSGQGDPTPHLVHGSFKHGNMIG
jgi:hypothetical protein